MGVYYYETVQERQPSANTIAYFPFKEDAADKVGSRTLTLSGCSVSDGVMNITSASSYMKLSSGIGGSQITMSAWYYFGALSSGSYNTVFARDGGTYHHLLIASTSTGGTIGNIGFYNSSFYPSSEILDVGNWYHLLTTKDGTNQKIYVNAELVLNSNSSFDNNSYPVGYISRGNETQGAQGKMSELFFENKIWDIDEITEYYNALKGNYEL